MSSSANIYELPEDLPIPVDDGACDHLTGFLLPDMTLMSTAGTLVNLAKLPERTVVYCYPRTGRPDQALPTGWDAIPGARGCTPQSCAYRDHYQELRDLGAAVYGLSTQPTDYQLEAVSRLQLPFALLSDAAGEFSTSLRLPSFEVEGVRLLKRLTLIVGKGRILHCVYPVFPPDMDAQTAVNWIRAHVT